MYVKEPIPGATMLDESFILATSAVYLITVVPACLLGITWAKVTLNCLSSMTRSCYTRSWCTVLSLSF